VLLFEAYHPGSVTLLVQDEVALPKESKSCEYVSGAIEICAEATFTIRNANVQRHRKA
jgi:hypothetical protein